MSEWSFSWQMSSAFFSSFAFPPSSSSLFAAAFQGGPEHTPTVAPFVGAAFRLEISQLWVHISNFYTTTQKTAK